MYVVIIKQTDGVKRWLTFNVKRHAIDYYRQFVTDVDVSTIDIIKGDYSSYLDPEG